MSDASAAREPLIDALTAIARRGAAPEALTKDLTEDLRRALLVFGSETPDNLACATRLEIGPLGDETGLKIRGRAALFSDIAHALESAATPSEVRDQFPELSDADWDAFTRLTTLIYSLLTVSAAPER